MNIQELMSDLPVLETERLVLRKFNNCDIEDLYEYCKDDDVTKYLSFDTYDTLENAQDRMDFLQAKYAEQTIACWAIELKYNDKVIGSIDIFNISDNDKSAEIGYVLNKDYWNKGYMTEASHRIIKYGFEVLGLVRIHASCVLPNISSEMVMKKCGMTFEGIERKALYIKGKYYNLKKYSIIDEEYQTNKNYMY